MIIPNITQFRVYGLGGTSTQTHNVFGAIVVLMLSAMDLPFADSKCRFQRREECCDSSPIIK